MQIFSFEHVINSFCVTGNLAKSTMDVHGIGKKKPFLDLYHGRTPYGFARLEITVKTIQPMVSQLRVSQIILAATINLT